MPLDNPMRVLPRISLLVLFSAVLLSGLLRAAAAQAPAHPSLFYSLEDLPGLATPLRGDAGRAILARLDKLLTTAPAAQQAAGFAIRHALAGDSAAGLRSLEAAETACGANAPAGDPEGSHKLLTDCSDLTALTIAYDLASNSWPLERRTAMARQLLQRSLRLLSLGSERNRLRLSGHEQAAASCAGGLAALAVSLEPNSPPEAGPRAMLARRAVLRFLAEQGGSGWMREGFANLRAALSSGVGPFLLAWRKAKGEDLLAASSGHRWAALYTMLQLPPRPGSPAPDPALFGAPSAAPGLLGGDRALLLCLSDSASRSALHWTYRTCLGSDGEGSFDVFKPSDALFALLALQRVDPPTNPASLMGLSWQDAGEGILLHRNRWADHEDALSGISANQQPVRGALSPADAGSFRLFALGGRWAVQRVRDDADRKHPSRARENVVLIAGTHGWQGGRVLHATNHPDGSGAVTIQLDKTYTVAPLGTHPSLLDPTQDLGLRVQRAWTVDYSGTCGAPVLMIVADQIRQGPTRRWVMHTGEREVTLTEEGFEIRAANGATLKGTIIAPARPRLTVEPGEETQTIAIDGEGDFFVVMTVQPQGLAHPRLERGAELGSRHRIGPCIFSYDGSVIAFH